MKLTDITPHHLLCIVAGCPAIFETDQGSYIVIGRKVAGLSVEVAARIAQDEMAIEIPRDLLAELIGNRTSSR